MNFLNEIFVLLFSLSGFLFGLVLALIAPEELKSGKKYFVLIKHILFCLIIISSLSLFIYSKRYYFILMPLIYSGLYLCIIRKTAAEEIFNYSFFILIYIVICMSIQNGLLIILPSLLFLYGLPAGTLARFKQTHLKLNSYLPDSNK